MLELQGGYDLDPAKDAATKIYFAKYRGVARKAIAAMCEPTHEMRESGLSSVESLVDAGYHTDTMACIWASMIAEALK